ncbi:MAG TPA: ATP-binding cassette domain-containing protein, partial [Vicinamibacteria bacterium]
MSEQQNYIFTMYRLSKHIPPDRDVLKDITLAFFPGAKIGVLGPNGAGKSTLLRIMAGEEKAFSGDALLAPGATVGLLHQEPELDHSKDVRGNVEDGVAGTRALLTRYEEISARLAEEMSPEEMEALLDEFQTVQDAIERANAWDLDRQLEVAMDALRCPPPEADVTTLSGGERRRV